MLPAARTAPTVQGRRGVITTDTVCHRLLSVGLRAHTPYVGPILINRHWNEHRRWAGMYRYWRLQRWYGVLFSDEFRFGWGCGVSVENVITVTVFSTRILGVGSVIITKQYPMFAVAEWMRFPKVSQITSFPSFFTIGICAHFRKTTPDYTHHLLQQPLSSEQCRFAWMVRTAPCFIANRASLGLPWSMHFTSPTNE